MTVIAEEIIHSYGLRFDALRARVRHALGVLWGIHGGPTQANQVAWVGAAVPVAIGSRAATAQLVDGYLAAILQRATTGIGLEPTDIRNGADPADVYARAIVTVRTALSRGHTIAEANQQGLDRALVAGETDVVLTQRAVGQRIMQAAGVVGYRRVLTGQSCAFCATASTRRYHASELMPLHPRCDCRIAPIVGTHDPGNVINAKLLHDLKHAARSTGTRDYWRARHLVVEEDGTVVMPDVAVHEHGELGPVLTAAGQHFDSLAA